ncbi:unnamed protein product, partial [Discosporangium mesarthrocarpum]
MTEVRAGRLERFGASRQWESRVFVLYAEGSLVYSKKPPSATSTATDVGAKSVHNDVVFDFNHDIPLGSPPLPTAELRDLSLSPGDPPSPTAGGFFRSSKGEPGVSPSSENDVGVSPKGGGPRISNASKDMPGGLGTMVAGEGALSTLAKRRSRLRSDPVAFPELTFSLEDSYSGGMPVISDNMKADQTNQRHQGRLGRSMLARGHARRSS